MSGWLAYDGHEPSPRVVLPARPQAILTPAAIAACSSRLSEEEEHRLPQAVEELQHAVEQLPELEDVINDDEPLPHFLLPPASPPEAPPPTLRMTWVQVELTHVEELAMLEDLIEQELSRIVVCMADCELIDSLFTDCSGCVVKARSPRDLAHCSFPLQLSFQLLLRSEDRRKADLRSSARLSSRGCDCWEGVMFAYSHLLSCLSRTRVLKQAKLWSSVVSTIMGSDSFQ